MYFTLFQPSSQQISGIGRNVSSITSKAQPFSITQLSQSIRPILRRGTVTVTDAPVVQSKWVGRWLGTCAGMCFGAVVIGNIVVT